MSFTRFLVNTITTLLFGSAAVYMGWTAYERGDYLPLFGAGILALFYVYFVVKEVD